MIWFKFPDQLKCNGKAESDQGFYAEGGSLPTWIIQECSQAFKGGVNFLP